MVKILSKLPQNAGSKCIVFANKTKVWLNDAREHHREDGPAIEYPNGSYEWRINDRLHRLDGPAKKNSDTKYWYVDGFLHREDGPAICPTQYGVEQRTEYYLFGVKITKEEYTSTPIDELIRKVAMIKAIEM